MKTQSRHCNNNSQALFMEYNLDVEITGLYCTCKAGTEVVWCCAHIASII